MTITTAGGTSAARRGTRGVAALLSTAVASAGLVALGVAAAPSASAAPISVSNATFTWDINNEVQAGAFAPGTWNLMSAGEIGNPGAGGQTLRLADNGATWSNNATAGWKSTAGNVTIEDKAADGTYAPATFDGTRRTSAGVLTSGFSQTNLAETRMVVKKGTGTLDPDAENAQIAWDGDATVLFYSGMTYFHLSDPQLVVTDGVGTLSATLGGYATSMDDMEAWTPVADTTITLATMTGVDVTPTGIAGAPQYKGVTYAAAEGSTEQVRTGDNWGAFPQAFVDFQQVLGQGPYWYSTGGSADPRKIANPFSVAYSEQLTPEVTISRTTFLPNGAQEITVQGTGFDPSAATGARPPLAGRPAGTYVAFGKFPEAWRPSAGVASANRKNSSQQWAVLAEDMATIGGPNAGAIELTPAGTFTATLTVDKAAADTAAAAVPTAANYGIYTYAGSGATAPSYETYTPLTFAKAPSAATISAPARTYGQASTATVTVTGEGAEGAVTLKRGTTVVGTADLVSGAATFALGTLGAGRHPLSATYDGTPNVEGATATATVTVAKAASRTTATLVKKPAPRKAGKVRAKVTTTPAGSAAGTVKVVVRNAKGKVVRTLQARLTRAGVATAKLPRLAKGTYRVVLTYTGNANVKASSKSLPFRVR
ncbi:Ig-like domain-containing protein [Nocardioides lijunqiniae]|uniref:Ig-like domain-containing protein n=1 Tax=Nocardioides lijunqiniae TaxID=2760832 RepID=UPI0018783C6D|nr:Ig-like domain-containing protein [Nocardioides lijunqiniae]